MKIQAGFGSRSKSGFALLETVMTLIMVSMALGAAAMVLGTAVKVVQQRSMMDARSLKAANCMAQIEAAFQGRELSDIEGELQTVCKNGALQTVCKNDALQTVCRNGATVEYLTVGTYPGVNKDEKDRTNYDVKFHTDWRFLLVSVTADNKTYRRLFSHPELTMTDGPVTDATVSAAEEGR